MTHADEDENDLLSSWMGIVRAVDAIQRHYAIGLEKELDLPQAFVPVLDLLAGASGQRLPVSQVGDRLRMPHNSLVRLLDRMARQGLIDRRGSHGDRSVVVAILTEDGAHSAQRAGNLIRTTIEGAMQNNATPADLGRTQRLLRRLADALPT